MLAGQTLFKLSIDEKDEMFNSYDTFRCNKIHIEDVVECKSFYSEGGKVIRDATEDKIRIKGEKYLVAVDSSDMYFESLDQVREHLLKEYRNIYENERYLVLMDFDNLNRNVVIKKPETYIGYSDCHISLYDLISI